MTKGNTNHFFCSSPCLDLSQMLIPSCKGCLEKKSLAGQICAPLKCESSVAKERQREWVQENNQSSLLQNNKSFEKSWGQRTYSFSFFFFWWVKLPIIHNMLEFLGRGWEVPLQVLSLQGGLLHFISFKT